MRSVKVIFAIFLALALMGGRALADDPEPADTAQPRSESLEAARKAVDAKDFKSAIQHLVKAEKETPKDADVQNLLGFSYRKLGQFDRAMEHYRLALKLDPRHRGAHEYIGELYLDLGQLANAEKELQDLKRACPWFGKCGEYDDLKEAIENYKAKKR